MTTDAHFILFVQANCVILTGIFVFARVTDNPKTITGEGRWNQPVEPVNVMRIFLSAAIPDTKN